VLDIGDQLRRYGEALERHLGEGGDHQVVTAAPARRRSQLWLVAAAVLVIALGSATFVVTRLDRDDAVVSTTPDSGDARTGVFSTPTDTVLLFSDGIDGATAIDLDRRIAGRRVIEGERAGDQSFRLTLTGDHLVVGWGEIYAAPLAGGASRKIADATIYVPASEPGEVWTLAWEGGRIGAGAATLQRVTVDGTVTFTSSEFDASVMHPVIGVPGGIAVDSPNGVAVWDADTGRTGPVLGPGPATAASSDGKSLAWCGSTCDDVHVVSLARSGPPTAQHVAPGSQQLALSDDGTRLAFLRPTGGRADLVIRDVNGREHVVARDLDPVGALQWSAGASQLFYSEGSYGESAMRIGRYEPVIDRWELRDVPVGDGLAALALPRAEARSFFTDRLSPSTACPGANGSYPSGREGTCTFAFSTPDSPDQCVADGNRSITVPDAVGRPLSEAIIAMQQAGLHVVGTGTPEDDPTGPEAVVRAQEPPAGERVPSGACVGFRTAR
jgi:hypothetical protein